MFKSITQLYYLVDIRNCLVFVLYSSPCANAVWCMSVSVSVCMCLCCVTLVKFILHVDSNGKFIEFPTLRPFKIEYGVRCLLDSIHFCSGSSVDWNSSNLNWMYYVAWIACPPDCLPACSISGRQWDCREWVFVFAFMFMMRLFLYINIHITKWMFDLFFIKWKIEQFNKWWIFMICKRCFFSTDFKILLFGKYSGQLPFIHRHELKHSSDQ